MPRASGLLAPLLGLGLGLTLSLQGVVAAASCGALGPAESLEFTPASRARWLAPRVRAPGPLDPLYSTVRRFLAVVQLNPFPAELVKSLLNEPESVKVDEVLRYQAGYVVCAVIAALYLLAVPSAGLCFCCCRRRRHCGGRVKTEHKALACQRGALLSFLLLTTLVLLVGVACAFATNQRVHEHTGPSVEAVPETLLSLRGLVSDVPQELQAVAEQFSLPQKRVLEDLDDVGLNIGSTIHAQLRGTVEHTLTSVQSLGQALQVSVDRLRALNATIAELRQGQHTLEGAVQELREQLLGLLQKPACKGCEQALSQARALQLGADFSQVPTVDDVLHRLQGVPRANFSAMVQEENSTFNALPALTALQVADRVQELRKAVEEQPTGLSSLAEGFPGWEAAEHWSRALEDAEQQSRPYLADVQRYERYRWILGCVLCSMVLLVIVCNLLGLGLGMWGLSAREDPSHSEARAEAGARLLMLSAALSFLFAVPLILLVFITFLVGGNVQTLLCRSWESGDLYEFADTPGNLPPSMNLTQLLGLKNISIRLAYRRCREGAALWEVLQLNDSYDLEKHLDISQYTTKLKEDLKDLRVNAQNLNLLSADAHRDLQAVQSSGIEKIQYPSFRSQLQRPVVDTPMELLAQELDQLAQAQGAPGLREQLQEKARGLSRLHQQQALPRQRLMATLNLSVRALEASAPQLQRETQQTLEAVAHLTRELPAWTNRILKNESECFLARETGYFSQYLDWVREEVTRHIATCQPLSGALDNSRVIVCDLLADPWNAFWFCLAWCTFLLIPSIIFAVKTAKYFRPIRKRLSSTSSEETQLFHIPRVTSLKL